jgi:hypothetical protein
MDPLSIRIGGSMAKKKAIKKHTVKASFLITYKPDSPIHGWPKEKFQRLIEDFHVYGVAEEKWRFASHKKVVPGDRAFLLLQGKAGPAIIGYGRVTGKAEYHREKWLVPIKFEGLVNPPEALATKEFLLSIEGGKPLWNTPFSGRLIPENIAAKLEAHICEEVADVIVASLEDPELDAALHETDIGLDFQEAQEGDLLTRTHLARERNPKLVKAKRDWFIKKHGKLFCEVCKFDFVAHYGERGKGFMECHHTQPVSTLRIRHKTHINDLALVCSNCHRMIHRRKPWLSLAELKNLIKARLY